MSYRSEVAIAMSRQDMARLEQEIVKQGLFPDVEEFRAFWSRRWKNGEFLIYGAEDVKWYSECPDVRFITNFLGTVEHQFLRVGPVLGDRDEVNTFSDKRKFFDSEPMDEPFVFEDLREQIVYFEDEGVEYLS